MLPSYHILNLYLNERSLAIWLFDAGFFYKDGTYKILINDFDINICFLTKVLIDKFNIHTSLKKLGTNQFLIISPKSYNIINKILNKYKKKFYKKF